MASKKITPLLLAASVLVSGFTGGFIQSKPALAITSVDELSDVNQNNWAYTALKDLVEKYNVIEGYPDRTFRGNRTATRYELAAALNATVKTMGKEIARLGAEKANKEDLAVVAKLQQEFATELKTLQVRSDALEARATKIEAKNEEQDNRLSVLEKMKVYGDVNFGGYGDISGNPPHTFSDAISAVGRSRINFDYPVVEDKGGNIVGPGTIHTRLVGAFGRVSPLEADTIVARNRFSGASQIAADSSRFNEGIRPNDWVTLVNGTGTGGIPGIAPGSGTVTGANTRANAYVDSAYYSQVLRAQIPYLPEDQSWKTSATMYMGLMPWRDLYFKSPYQGIEGYQFQNTALINNPAILPNVDVPRFALKLNQGLGKWANATVKTDAGFMDISDAINGLTFTVEADLGYNLGFLNNIGFLNNACKTRDIFNVSGNIFGGYYLIHPQGGGTNNLSNVAAGIPDPATAAVGTLPTTTGPGNTAQGWYAGMNQEIYKGIGAFGSFSGNTTGPTTSLMNALQDGTGTNVAYNNSTLAGIPAIFGIKQAWVAGGEIPIRALPHILTFGKRQRDVFGGAVSFIFPNNATGSPSTLIPLDREKVAEFYYRIQVNDGFSLIPSVQLILDRLATDPNASEVVIGFRSNFTF